MTAITWGAPPEVKEFDLVETQDEVLVLPGPLDAGHVLEPRVFPAPRIRPGRWGGYRVTTRGTRSCAWWWKVRYPDRTTALTALVETVAHYVLSDTSTLQAYPCLMDDHWHLGNHASGRPGGVDIEQVQVEVQGRGAL